MCCVYSLESTQIGNSNDHTTYLYSMEEQYIIPIMPLDKTFELSMRFQLLILSKIMQIMVFFWLKHSYVVFILLINVKVPTIVGILTFMS